MPLTSACSICGTYEKKEGWHAVMNVKSIHDKYEIYLESGVTVGSDARAPADCIVRATGHLRNTTLNASFLEVKTYTFSYDSLDAKRENRQLQVIFSNGSAEVVRSDTFGYCGLGTNLLGHYHKK